MAHPDKTRFLEALDRVTPYLPISYGVLIADRFPALDIMRVHQVKARRCVDWDILKALQAVALAEPRKSKARTVAVRPETFALEVYEHGGMDCVDSRAVAQGLGVEHRALLASIDKYRQVVEAEFGLVAFVLLPRIVSQHGGADMRYAHLNEGQASVLGTFAQNTPEAVTFKVKLVAAFQRAKKLLRTLIQEQPTTQPLLTHTQRPVQVANSRSVNAVMFERGGIALTKQYNQTHCKLVTGMYPHEVKSLGKQRGLRGRQLQSAKEVSRILRPELACQMSLDDELCANGLSVAEAVELTKGTLAVFRKMVELGMAPAELRA